jgi:hypothetical protein
MKMESQEEETKARCLVESMDYAFTSDTHNCNMLNAGTRQLLTSSPGR